MAKSFSKSMKPVPLSKEAQLSLDQFSLWDILYARSLNDLKSTTPISTTGTLPGSRKASRPCGLERILTEMENLLRLTRALVMDLVHAVDQPDLEKSSAHWLSLPESLTRAWGFPSGSRRYQYRAKATISASLPWFPDLDRILPPRMAHPADREVDVSREFALPGTTITKVIGSESNSKDDSSHLDEELVADWIGPKEDLPSVDDSEPSEDDNDILSHGASDPIERTVELILNRTDPKMVEDPSVLPVITGTDDENVLEQGHGSPVSPLASIALPDFPIRSSSSEETNELVLKSAPIRRNTQRHRDWFACPKCKTFVGNLKLHLKVCNGIKSRRLRYHLDGNKYYCREANCSDLETTAFNTFWQFESHCKSEHLTPDDYQHECQTCHKKFYNRMKLVKHRSNNHRILPASKVSGPGTSVSDTLHTCQICGMKFRQAPSMKRHINRKHPEIADKPRYCCDICGKGYLVEAHLQRHLERVHYNPVKFKKESQTCHRCGYTNSYSESQKFYRHVKFNCPMLDGNQCQCPICGARLRYSTGLRTHIREVHRLDANEVLGTPRRANSSAVPKPKNK